MLKEWLALSRIIKVRTDTISLFLLFSLLFHSPSAHLVILMASAARYDLSTNLYRSQTLTFGLKEQLK